MAASLAAVLVYTIVLLAPVCTTEFDRRGSTVLTTLTEPTSTATPRAGAELKVLHQVPDEVRVPDSYFVNIRYDVAELRIRQLADELRSMDADQSLPAFSAKVQFVLTKLGYGISAKLSAEALYYVSPLFMSVCMKYIQ